MFRKPPRNGDPFIFAAGGGAARDTGYHSRDGVLLKRQPAGLPAPSVVLFAIPLVLILSQIQLFAAELSDTRVFLSALVIAFCAAWHLARLKIAVIPFLLTAALSPFAARWLIMLPRVLLDGNVISGAMIRLDALLLNFDRNMFVFLAPFYGTMIAVYFSTRFPRSLPAMIAASDVLFIVIFSIGKSGNIPLYAKPLTLILLIGVIVFLQALALILSARKTYAVRAGEKTQAALLTLFLIALGGILALKPAEEGSIGKGGGLLEPKLFSFDFAPFLHLENEISMNDSLVFIARKGAANDNDDNDYDNNDGHYLLRRFVLSSFDKKNGWTRNSVLDEEAHPNKLPNRSVTYKKDERKAGMEITSDYFLVNIDPGAFIALAEPVKVTPYYTGDTTSYKTSYSVVSSASGALPYELIGANTDDAEAEAEKDFSAIDVDYYTHWEGDPRVKALAETLTAGVTNYWEKAQTVYLYLKYGDYRYSLKPGSAVDGDQLGQFLFDNKKGYCSYFAFAYAALLRSIAIPARIAVGFFINPNEERLGFYPVRANMAHAWVEVFFPEYGWIEFDPTTEQLAEGENFTFGDGLPPEFEHLIKEILETERIPKEGESEDGTEPWSSAAAAWTKGIARFVAENRLVLLGALVLVALANHIAGFYVRALLTKDRRKKARYRYRFVTRLLSLKSYTRKDGETEAEFARSLEEAAPAGTYPLYTALGMKITQCILRGKSPPRYGRKRPPLPPLRGSGPRWCPLDTPPPESLPNDVSMPNGVYQIYQMAEKARFAREWTDDDETNFNAAFRAFLKNYTKLKPRKKPAGHRPLLFLALLCGAAVSGSPEDGIQETGTLQAETLLAEASEAQTHENWEKAVELYTRGKTLFTDDFRFPYYLGTLYSNQGLYRLAFDEFRIAETKAGPDDSRILYALAETAGPLNLYAESARYYEAILRLVPEDTDVIANLGWLYFKLHRLDDGAALLENAIETFGDNLKFYTTLAIIYSDRYRYDQSADYYKRTIAITESTGRYSSASLAHYNYSILESRFYHYDRALAETEASLFWEDRFSGYLARGEMQLNRFHFSAAVSDYETARETDPTTLSKVSLAQVRQTQGRLDEALLLAREALDSPNLSWMLNFGINEDQYKRDIYDILAKTSWGLYYRSRNTVYAGIREKAANLANIVRHYVNGMVYQHLYEKYTLRFAGGFNAAQNGVLPLVPENLEVLSQYVHCFDKYPRRALSYLQASRRIETSLIPESGPSYTRAEGGMKGDTTLLLKALGELDPVWEVGEIAEAYENLYRQYRKAGETGKAREAAENLYLVNRGALVQNGIPLPVRLTCDFDGIDPQTKKRLTGTLASLFQKSGFTIQDRAAFTLSVYFNGTGASAELYETAGGTSMVRKTFTPADLSRPGLARLTRDIAALSFTAE
jgi:transglutaminase-like putative cysteine protease